MISLKFVTLSWARIYFGERFISAVWYYFFQMHKLKIYFNYYSPISVLFIAITIYSVFDYFNTTELSNSFSLLTSQTAKATL